MLDFTGAGDEVRTRDPQLGKLAAWLIWPERWHPGDEGRPCVKIAGHHSRVAEDQHEPEVEGHVTCSLQFVK